MYHVVTQKSSSPDPEESAAPGGEQPEGADAPSAERARKERVLHTRIPAVLEQELKRFADNLRVPVSNLVRTILEDAIAVADRASGRVEAELQAVARAASDQRKSLKTKLRPKSILDEVFGFQSIVLAQETLCTGCGSPLPSGSQAWLGLRDVPGPRVIACAHCLPSGAGPSST